MNRTAAQWVNWFAIVLPFGIGVCWDANAEAQPYTIGEAKSVDESQTSLLLLRDEQAHIEAAIAPSKGGELSGLRVRYQGQTVETIYLARDYSPRDGWTGKAPLLWPATGRNFPADLEARQRAGERFSTGAYSLNGTRYEMPIHGFARDLPWNVKQTVADTDGAFAALVTTDSPATRNYYPFGFSLEVTYRLRSGELSIRYEVQSDPENVQRMPFSIGNHITFNCPLVAGSDADAVELITPSETELLKSAHGLPTGVSRSRSHADGIALGEFERLAAVSLTGYRQDPYVLYRDPRGLAIRMTHTASTIPRAPVVLFNLWGDANGGFFSPEPWVGLQNSLVLDQGLVRLMPGERFEWTIRIAFERD